MYQTALVSWIRAVFFAKCVLQKIFILRYKLCMVCIRNNFFAVNSLYQYQLLRAKTQCNLAICSTIVAIVYLVLYVLKG